MKHRIILFTTAIIFSVLYWQFDFFKNPNILGVCVGVEGFCKSDWLDGIWFPIYKSLIYIIFSIALLIFFPYTFLKTWMKIMLPFAFIAFFFIVMTPPLCGGMICFDRTLIASGLSKIFLTLTILILLSKSIYLFIISKKFKINL
jgi:hypothetical protein